MPQPTINDLIAWSNRFPPISVINNEYKFSLIDAADEWWDIVNPGVPNTVNGRVYAYLLMLFNA